MRRSRAVYFFVLLALIVALEAAPGESHAAGGRSVGNGGDAVVCRQASGAIASIELLDFYEARVQRGIERELGGVALSVDAKIERALARLDRLSPARARRYRAQAREFFSDALFLPRTELVDIPDSGHLSFPAGCRVEQVAIRQEKRFAEDRRYTVNQDLWDAMDADSRAGLVLHEVIYAEAIANRHEDSRAARYFNSYLTSRKIEALSREEFVRFLAGLPFEAAEIQGVEVSLFDPETGRVFTPVFFPSGALKEARAVHDSAFFWNGLGLHLSGHPAYGDSTGAPTVVFHENGQPETLVLSRPFPLPILQGTLSVFGKTRFFPSGRVRGADVLRGSRLEISGRAIELEGETRFYESGQVEALHLSSRQAIPIAGSGSDEVEFEHQPSNQSVTFHSNGCVASGPVASGFVTAFGERYELAHTQMEVARFFENGELAFARVLSGFVRFGGARVALSPRSLLAFSSRGEVREAGFAEPVSFAFPGAIPGTDPGASARIRRFVAADDGSLKLLELAEPVSMRVGLVDASFEGELQFHPGGSVRQGILAKAAWLVRRNGKKERYGKGSIVFFSPDGWLGDERN